MLHPQLPILVCLTLSLPCAAWDVRTDSEGDLVRWAKPLQMVLDSRVAMQLHDAHAEDAIRAALQGLDDATPYLDVSMIVGEGKPIGYVVGRTDNQNSILALEDWPYSEDALAVTLVTLNARTNELLDADVAFNIEKHHFRVLPEGAREERFDDVQNTVTHELGHVLGLMHSAAAEDLVMYPSAPPGELIKRVLKTDDRDGLLSLYGTEPEPKTTPPQLLGCSATSTPPGWLALAGLGLVLLRRGKRLALLALTPALALAAAPLPDAVTRAEEVALVQVSSRQSLQHPRHPGLIVTELTIASLECLKGPCAALSRVWVAGGRVGDLEQIAVHEAVPTPGQRILVTRTAGTLRVLRVEPQAQQQIVTRLRSQGSTGPAGAGVPPGPTLQVPAFRP